MDNVREGLHRDDDLTDDSVSRTKLALEREGFSIWVHATVYMIG